MHGKSFVYASRMYGSCISLLEEESDGGWDGTGRRAENTACADAPVEGVAIGPALIIPLELGLGVTKSLLDGLGSVQRGNITVHNHFRYSR